MTKLLPLSLLLLAMAAPLPAFAQSCNSANTVHGAATIPVLVDRGATTLADSGKSINNYAIRLGAFDQFEQICVTGEAAATLSRPRYLAAGAGSSEG